MRRRRAVATQAYHGCVPPRLAAASGLLLATMLLSPPACRNPMMCVSLAQQLHDTRAPLAGPPVTGGVRLDAEPRPGVAAATAWALQHPQKGLLVRTVSLTARSHQMPGG